MNFVWTYSSLIVKLVKCDLLLPCDDRTDTDTRQGQVYEW